MENRFSKLLNDIKLFIVMYLDWFLINLIFFNMSDSIYTGFWPIGNNNLDSYNITEFLFYMFVPIVLLVIWILTSESIKKYLNQES